MSVTPRTITPAQLTTSAATYYTCPSNTKAVIKKLTFTNTTGGAVTFTLHLVPQGGSASSTNMLISAQSVGAGECFDCFQAQGQTLQGGGTIQALASANTSITILGAVAEVVQ